MKYIFFYHASNVVIPNICYYLSDFKNGNIVEHNRKNICHNTLLKEASPYDGVAIYRKNENDDYVLIESFILLK